MRKKTNAPIDGELEADMVVLGVKQDLTKKKMEWFKEIHGDLMKMITDDDYILTSTKYKRVFKHGNWKACFNDMDMWNTLIQKQNEKGAWVADDEETVWKYINGGIECWKKYNPLGVDGWSVESMINELKRMTENGYSLNGWSLCAGANLDWKWKKTSRPKQNLEGKIETIAEMIRPMARKENPTEDWIVKKYFDLMGKAGRVGYGDAWSNAYQQKKHKILIERRKVVQKFMASKDYSVFGDAADEMKAKIERALKSGKISLQFHCNRLRAENPL